MPQNELRRGATVYYVVEGDGEFRCYSMEVLQHDGTFTVIKGKITSGETFADGLIPTGTDYFENVPHGDPGQGGTWIWGNEIPRGFYVG